MTFRRRLAHVLITLAALAFTLVATRAQAATCYGDYCSGQNPYSTGCAADSYRWGYANIYGSVSSAEPDRQIGRLELWISRTCATRWARFEKWETTLDSSSNLVVWQSDGYRQQFYGDMFYPGTYYTNQIYNRSLCSWAELPGGRTGCAVW